MFGSAFIALSHDCRNQFIHDTLFRHPPTNPVSNAWIALTSFFRLVLRAFFACYFLQLHPRIIQNDLESLHVQLLLTLLDLLNRENARVSVNSHLNDGHGAHHLPCVILDRLDGLRVAQRLEVGTRREEVLALVTVLAQLHDTGGTVDRRGCHTNDHREGLALFVTGEFECRLLLGGRAEETPIHIPPRARFAFCLKHPGRQRHSASHPTVKGQARGELLRSRELHHRRREHANRGVEGVALKNCSPLC
mmetsp:Transcript_88527/g.235578  ORF Transcript_88527/g.235578 Transcript_88527/m.235578 type:complete len:249 (-) Transcript_88527:106-852(-)